MLSRKVDDCKPLPSMLGISLCAIPLPLSVTVTEGHKLYSLFLPTSIEPQGTSNGEH
jgi:hypothetical protein